MNIICLGVGDTHLGRRTTGPDGEIISETKAHWEPNPNGGSVAIWTMDAETQESAGPASVYGDWDAAHYLAKVLELLHPHRQINLPNLKAMILAAEKDGCDICDYCQASGYNCRDCIITEWREDRHDE